jgi:hypothetical protein
MQLFILDYEPCVSAQMMSDCHIIKMCLETAQILSSVRFNKGFEHNEIIPKPYNTKHPVITAIDNQEKINWLLDYNRAIHSEYVYRFNKHHAYFKLIEFYEHLRDNSIKYYDKSKLNFARDFKDFTTTKTDLIESFREYYKMKKSIIKRWKYTKRSEPEWMKREDV